MSLTLIYSAGIAAVLILVYYGNVYWEKAKYQRIAKEYILRKKMEKEASNKLENTPNRSNTPDRISRFSSSRRSTKSMMQLPGLGQDSPFKNPPASLSAKKAEQMAAYQLDASRGSFDQPRQNGFEQSRSFAYTPSTVGYTTSKPSNYSNGSNALSSQQPLPNDSHYRSPFGIQDSQNSTPNFTPTKNSSQINQIQGVLPLNSLMQNSSNDIQFKMPRALAKDTPRPSQSGSLPNMPQLRHAYAPSSPSPLNFPTLSKNILSASGENNPNKEDKHENIFSAKDDDEIENIKNDSKAGQSDKSRVDSKKKVQEMQVDDVQEKRESRPSKKRPAENGAQSTPSIRRKKTVRPKKVVFLDEKKPPASVRKGAVPVAVRKTVYEGNNKPLPSYEEKLKDSQASKRKLPQNENEINPAFLPDHGFNWIGGEPKGKRIKLDKDTIVRKRIEYFRSLGVEIPSGANPTDSPTLQKLREVPRIKIREDAVSNRGRMAFSTPKKSKVDNELWKVDDDELDEMTMKRLEDGGTPELILEQGKKNVSFESESSVKENLTNGESSKSISFGDAKPKPGNETSFALPTDKALKTETPATLQFGKNPEKSATTPAFNFKKPSGDDLRSRLGDKPTESVPATLFNFGNVAGDKPSETKASVSTATTVPSSVAVPSVGINEKPASLFAFGTPAAVPSSEKTDKANDSSKPTFNFATSTAKPAEKPSFNFIGDATKPGDTKPISTPTFNFGGVDATKPAEGGKPPVFNLNTEPPKSTETVKAPMFNFGAPPAEPAKPTFSFGGEAAKSSDTAKPPAFNFTAAKPNEQDKPQGFGGFGGFGAKPDENSKAAEPAKPAVFGGFGAKPDENSTVAEPAKPVAFGGFGGATKASEPAKPQFSFGTPTPALTTTSPAPFSFPSSNTASANPPAFGATPTPAFGTGASTNSNPIGAPVGSGAATTSNTPAFGQSAASTGFGSATNPSPAFGQSNPSPAFGNTSASTSQPFGSKAPSTTTPAFGSTPAAPSGFQFGSNQASTPATNTTAPTGFSFGSSAGSSAAKTSDVPAFGQNNTFGQTPSGFGAPAQQQQTNAFGKQNPSTNAFGTPATATNAFGTPAPATNSFGQSTSQPAAFGGFGANTQTQNSTPAFGQPQQQTPQPKPSFNFGEGTSQQPPAFGGGGFGTPSQASTQFQFGQTAPPSTPGTPGFQFGAGGNAPQFTAQPLAAAHPGRSIAQPKFRRGPKGRR